MYHTMESWFPPEKKGCLPFNRMPVSRQMYLPSIFERRLELLTIEHRLELFHENIRVLPELHVVVFLAYRKSSNKPPGLLLNFYEFSKGAY